MNNEERGNGLLYFIAGTAVGAALGVLFAPKAGAETREELGNWLKERRENGTVLLRKVKDESLVKKEALLAAAKAAKDAYVQTNDKHHSHA